MKLKEPWISILTSLPETGMGYQKVRFIMKNGNIIPNLVVLNCEQVELPENTFIDMNNVESILLEK